MKRRILVAAAAALLLANTNLSANAGQVTDFADVAPNAWYYNAVEYATENGLFAGTSADTFRPGLAMTRGMFVTVLGRLASVTGDKPENSSFTDVAPSAYYAPYVEWAAENGIVNGTSATTFAPEQKITREQMVTILHRYYGGDSLTERELGTPFDDGDTVSPYAREAMGWAVARGLIAGTGDQLEPKATATRAQVAQVFYNARSLINGETEPETVQPESSLEKLRRLVEEQLPESCQWDERALQAGWYGPMSLRMNGSLENIADGCVYLLTELDGITYDVWYLTEPEPGSFVCFYG